MALKGGIFNKRRPDWAMDAGAGDVRRLDVRPLLARGEEPLHSLLELAGNVALSEVFVVEAPFDPAPLRRMFSHMGFEDHAEKISDNHWRIYFRRVASSAEADGAANGTKAARIWSEAEGWHIDVSGLEPPEPMLAIISLIETPAIAGPIIVHHEREPVYLYPELAERGWRWAQIEGDIGEFRLRLERERA